MLTMDAFLSDAAGTLGDVASFLGASLEPLAAKRIARGPAFTHYAKDTSVRWNATVQAQLVAGRYAVHKEAVDDAKAQRRVAA